MKPAERPPIPRRPGRDEPGRLPHLGPAARAEERRRRRQARPAGVRRASRYDPATPAARRAEGHAHLDGPRRPADAGRRARHPGAAVRRQARATTSPTPRSTSRRRSCSTIMGWAPNGRSYTRLRDVLRRLKSLTIRYENAWWDVGRPGLRGGGGDRHHQRLPASPGRCRGPRTAGHGAGELGDVDAAVPREPAERQPQAARPGGVLPAADADGAADVPLPRQAVLQHRRRWRWTWSSSPAATSG